ncbi:MAG TPA: glycosyltransferase family 4 protein [Acidimicrobiales bacterium]|nr:glycosyltransferase family 4 protein [Acidimicrobiales bacterium]
MSGRPGDTATPGGAAAPSVRLDQAVAAAGKAGLASIHILAWRDLDDPEAGGSELHAHRIATLWAAAGLDVTLRTSRAAGYGPDTRRDGYRVVRKAGRYAVFPRSALSGLVGRRGRPDGLVEIWNGMPFFSPLWARCPRIVFLHHVHAEMWQMVMSRRLAPVGAYVERRLAPPFYRHSRIVTLSSSSRDEIVSMLRLSPEQVSVVPPGVDPRFTPGSQRSPDPLVLAVGRLVPVKRFDLLIDELVSVRRNVPGLRARIIGEGYERPHLEARIRAAGAGEWIELVGRQTEDELLDAYRRAWVLVSTSQREGWGMTITEAAACETPAVVTRIAGHSDAVVHGTTGILVDRPSQFGTALETVLRDETQRRRLGRSAREHAARLTWEATAAGTLEALVGEAEARREGRPHR